MADGHCIRVRALDVQNGAKPEQSTIWLDLENGYFERAEAEGEDDTIPGADGRDVGVYRRSRRLLVLQGFTKGIGGTEAERWDSWHAAQESLLGVMPMHSDPGLVEVDGPYLGIPTGTTRFLYARCVRQLGGPVLNHMAYQAWSFTLECIDSPPEWQTEPS